MNITVPVFDNEETENLKKCLDSKWVTQGPFVNEFEQRFSQRHEVTHAMATTSCTAALHMAVLALGIGPGDEVIVPAFTWVTSAHCVEYTGAKVVFCDVDPKTFNIDPEKIEEKITSNTKAIVAVHLFGLSAPMNEILSIATKYNLKVIEDAACAVGSSYEGKHVGAIGDIGCFSFHPRKVITTGEGGMVTTNDENLANKIKVLRNHGATGPRTDIPADKAYHMATFNAIGFNYRMSDIQAAIGVAQMDKLDAILKKRMNLAKGYSIKLDGIEGIVIPEVPEGSLHTYQSYVIRIIGDDAHARRNQIMDFMAEKGIQTRPGTHAVHRLGYYVNKYGIKPEDFPNACICEDTSMAIPICHDMTDDDQGFIVETLKGGVAKTILFPENKEWLDEFHREHGRAPCVLHIGNIANNAYLNAKSLNEVGLDCDVICYNYYHMMGCPEWEDADFNEEEITNQFFPNWVLINLNGFKRPRWFTQGPLRFCIHYLIAKRDEKKLRTIFWWNILMISHVLLCSPPGIALQYGLRAVRNRLLVSRIALQCETSAVLDLLLASRNRWWYLVLRLTFYLPVKILKYVWTLTTKITLPVPKQTDKYSFDERVKDLVEFFSQKFPNRDDKLNKYDLEAYKGIIPFWRKLFSRYDIIQAYSTDPIIPLLADMPYFALEHGTLREIPFQQNGQGRMTAISYSFAEHVFVTNADCLENARKLADDRITFINHPYDEDHGLNKEGWQELRQELLMSLDVDFLFFFPTRHDWVPGTGNADKANDLFLRSFVRLRNDSHRVGMVCCQWGSNVRQSKDLLKENNCSFYVRWVKPMGTIRFERMARACDIVVDQFKLGSFGGVMFKAMAVGSPICTYLNEAKMRTQYADVPPIVNCKTEEEIVTRMKKIIEDPSVLEDMSKASRKWIKQFYGSAETVNAQLSRYKKYFEKYKII